MVERDTLLRVAEVEKERVTELNQMLSTELADCKVRGTVVSVILTGNQGALGRLETQLRVERKSRALLEHSSRRYVKLRKSLLYISFTSNNYRPLDMSLPENQIEVLRAENAGLQDALDNIVALKDSEAAVLKQLINQMRRVFSEGLKSYKEKMAR